MTKIASLLLLLPLLVACSRTERTGAGPGMTPKQQELWKKASARKIDAQPAADPAPERKFATASDETIAAKPITLPADAKTALRLVSGPSSGFTGLAGVVSVEGERITLDLGRGQQLVLLARVDGKPLGAKAGDTVQVDYRQRDAPRNGASIFAIRLGNGVSIALIQDSGEVPVRIAIPMLDFRADQAGATAAIRVGGATRTLAIGQTAPVGELNVTLIDAVADAATPGELLEGSRYSLALLVWRAAV